MLRYVAWLLFLCQEGPKVLTGSKVIPGPTQEVVLVHFWGELENRTASNTHVHNKTTFTRDRTSTTDGKQISLKVFQSEAFCFCPVTLRHREEKIKCKSQAADVLN